MRGVLTSVSAREISNIITTEIVLVKKDFHINDLDIKRYLFWQRRNFWINPRPLHLDRIQVRGFSFDDFSETVGFWRAWNFDSNNNIIESLFYIREDFQLTRYLNSHKFLNHNIQKCTFDASKGYRGRINLHLNAYPNIGYSSIGNIFLRLPKEDSGAIVMTGVQNYIGLDEFNPTSSVIALVKEDEIWQEIFADFDYRKSSPALLNKLNLKQKLTSDTLKEEIENNKNSKLLYQILNSSKH
jgi:hypothetical protein